MASITSTCSSSATILNPECLRYTQNTRSASQVSFASFSGLKSNAFAVHNQEASFTTKPLNGKISQTKIHTSNPKMRAGVARAATFKVAVLGAGGGIGQPLSLLIKMSPLVSEVRLYDIANVKGVAADLSHCNTPAKVTAYTGPAELPSALIGADLVIIPAGIPRKPGMTRDDLFKINAGIVKSLIEGVAEHCPNALINIISNPVNSTVPIASEVLKSKGVYDPRKLFGVTTLDIVRANTFVAESKGLRLIDVDVPVIGGHAGVTILPLLSLTKPSVEFTPEEAEQLTVRIQNAGTEVVEAKAGAGSATLSMAYAAARFAESCMRGLDGDPDVFECSYVDSDVTELPFFASRVKLGKNGIEGFIKSELDEVTDFEKKGLEALMPELKGSIEKGIAFANASATATA